MSLTRSMVAAEARSWLGTPFQHQQRSLGQGVDCAGLLIGVARGLGLVANDFDVTAYSAVPDGKSLRRYCEANMTRIAQAEMDVADAVLVAWENGPPQHLGIVVDYAHGGFAMVHAEGKRHRRVIETRLLFGRSMRFVAAYRLPGVA